MGKIIIKKVWEIKTIQVLSHHNLPYGQQNEDSLPSIPGQRGTENLVDRGSHSHSVSGLYRTGALADSWWCSFHCSIQRIPTQEAQYSSEVKGTRNWKVGDDRERPLTIWLQASVVMPSKVRFSHPLPLSKRQSEQWRTTASHLHLFFLPPWGALLGSCYGDNGAMSNKVHSTKAPENQGWPCWKCVLGRFIVLKEKMGIWPEWGKHCKALCL